MQPRSLSLTLRDFASDHPGNGPIGVEEAFVQIRPSSCSPETLRQLQNIFDAVWRELEQQKGRDTFPWAIEATRFTIARLVLEHVNDLRNPVRIKRQVLRELKYIGDADRQSPQDSLPGTHSVGAGTGVDTNEVRALLEMLRGPQSR
jgi:hypothetical protein